MPAKLRMKVLVLITTWAAHTIRELIDQPRQWRILAPRVPALWTPVGRTRVG